MSFGKAAQVMGKVVVVSILGFMLASNCCLPTVCVPIGVVALAMAAGWLDVIREECSRRRFFPSARLNSAGALLFHWRWLATVAAVIFAISSTSSLLTWVPQVSLSLGALQNMQGEFRTHLSSLLRYAAVPLAVMLLGKAIEPYRFSRLRADVQTAQELVWQLASAQMPSGISVAAPLTQLDLIPLYKLGSVASLLRDVVQESETAHKLKVEIPQSGERAPRQLLAAIYAPFHLLGDELFLWNSRDIVLYVVVALYIALLYIGSFYFPWAPLCIIIPFLGPRSKAARYLRAVQQDIWIAQGGSVEKTYGLTSTESREGYLGIEWPLLVFFLGTHIMAVYAVVVFVAFDGVCPLFGDGVAMKWETIAWTAAMYMFSALGVTAGVHRLWAHRSYKAGLPLRIFLMLANSVANQGCIFHWAKDHRVHHLYSDTVADPHDASRGFWFSHVGWLLLKRQKAVVEAEKKLDLSDLYADPVVMFQKAVDPFWNLICCFALPAFPVLAWGDSPWNGFLLAGVLRYALLLNATWAVNSFVHSWGTKPYNPAEGVRTTENGWVSLFAIGEGWHNWHHAFPWDYAAAEMGALSQYNPTKVFIDTMAFFGLARQRKRANLAWAQRKARWEKEIGRPVLESLEGPPLFKRRVVAFGPADYGGDSAGLDESEGRPVAQSTEGTTASRD